MVPFESLSAVSYSSSIVTMAFVSFARYSGLLVKNREIFIPHLYRNFAKMFDTHKTRMTGLPCGEETDNMLSRFDRILERDGLTDKRTDRRRNINLARQFAHAR